MQYKCIKKIKGKGFLHLFGGFFFGEAISVDQFNKLPAEKKACFEVNYEDESFAEQLQRNIENDKEDA